MTEKSYLEHLNSLRNVLLRSLGAIALIFFVLVFFRNEIFLVFANPLTEILPANSSMIATGVVSPFLTPLRLTFYVATFVAIPYLLFELWNFIAPGLYKEEKIGFFAVLFSSIVLFLAGICFAFFVIFPLIFTFFVQASPSEVLVMTDINEYIDFVVRILFVFGFAFEVPIVLMLMIWVWSHKCATTLQCQTLRDHRMFCCGNVSYTSRYFFTNTFGSSCLAAL